MHGDFTENQNLTLNSYVILLSIVTYYFTGGYHGLERFLRRSCYYERNEAPQLSSVVR